MTRLCENLSPLLTAENIKCLNARNIYTVCDFLDKKPAKIAEFTALSFKDIVELRQTFISNLSSFPQNAMEVYKDFRANSALVISNIPSFDAFLDGGLLTGELLEIYGASGHGKTQLCLTLTANVALHLKQQVYYIDCKNDFSGVRLQQILQSRRPKDVELGMAMERVKVIRPTFAHQLFTSLCDLHQEIFHQQDTHTRPRLIIVDSLCALFYGHLGETSKVFGLLCSLGTALRQIACEMHLPVVMVNLEKSWYEENEEIDKQPAFGKIWASFPNTRLHVTKEQNSIHVKVSKSTRLPCNKFCVLKISRNGIE